MNEYVKAVGQTFVCSFKDDEGLNYDLEIKEKDKGRFDLSIGDRDYTMEYDFEDGVEELYIEVEGGDNISICRDIYFAGLVEIVDKLVDEDDRLLGVAIVFIVDGKMLDYIDVEECVDCRVEL